MRTTIRFLDDLLKRASEEHRTLTSLVEEGVALVLARPTKRRRDRIDLPVSPTAGGVLPGVDLNRSTDLEALMEDA